MPVITSGPGYNGVTGAKAQYDAGSGMWIDTNGQQIRSDAIVPGEPPASAAPSPAAAPAAPAGPPAAGGGPVAGAGDAGSMPSSMMAIGQSQPLAPAQSLPASKSALNPNLGKRIYPESMNAIARMGRIAY